MIRSWHASYLDPRRRVVVDCFASFRVADLAATARQFGAFQRARKVRNAEELLRLIFLYGPAHLSLRSTAAAADDAGMACLSDKGVLGQLRKSADWLEHLLQCLLLHKQGLSAGTADGALDLALVDGSVICAPGSKGADWRLHARFDPGRGGFADLVLSKGNVSERVDRTKITAGQTMIQDRGYARVRDFAAVLAAKADFITRIGWRSLRLLSADQQPIDLLARLPLGEQPSEHIVGIKGIKAPLRLVIQRIPPEKAERQRKRVARKAGKAGHKIDPRTSIAAGYLMLITSLSAAQQPAERIVSMYRNRWQVELAPGTKAFLACRPVDLRNGFDGLVSKAQQVIGADPFSGHLFLFRGKRGDYLKALYWDGSGLCLFAKRLEKGRFVWPPIVDGAMTLTPAQLALLIEAMDWRRTIAPPLPAQPMLV